MFFFIGYFYQIKHQRFRRNEERKSVLCASSIGVDYSYTYRNTSSNPQEGCTKLICSCRPWLDFIKLYLNSIPNSKPISFNTTMFGPPRESLSMMAFATTSPVFCHLHWKCNIDFHLRRGYSSTVDDASFDVR